MRKLLLIVSAVVVCGVVVLTYTPQTSVAKPAQPAAKTTKPTTAAAAINTPPAITAAFKTAYPNATIKKVSKEKENGLEQYEVESVDGTQNRDLVYLADGTLLQVEEEVTEAAFPSSVSAAIKARYPNATITKREKLTISKGSVVQYEAAIKGAGKVKEVTLTPDGKWVSPK